MSEREDDRADRLRTARVRAGYLTAADAARAMGAVLPTYLGHENGSRGFAKTARKYARFFKVRLEWLLEGQGTMTANPLEEAWARLPPEGQAEALAYLEYLQGRFSKK